MEIPLKDIVEQLRMRDMPLCVEAAAEIEQLRETVKEQMREVTMLRRALESKP